MGLFNRNQWEPKAPAKAIRAYLEASELGHESNTEVDIAEWNNCRERGYTIRVRKHANAGFDCRNRLHISFFEHRSSDAIVVRKFRQDTPFNPPTVQDIDFDNVEEKSFSYNETFEASEYIYRLIHMESQSK